MPLYEYGCEKCGHVVEKLQSSPDSPAPQACAKCGAQGGMTRLISSSNFQLKGSGWYVTDYASPKKGGGKPSTESSSSESSSTESKSAGADSGSDSGGSSKASESTD